MPRENPDVPSLKALQNKIDAAKKSSEPKSIPSGSLYGQAMHVAIDLVTGTVVGTVIGYFLDKWFGSLPVCTLLGLCIGIAAGVKLMMRTLRELDKQIENDSEASKE